MSVIITNLSESSHTIDRLVFPIAFLQNESPARICLLSGFSLTSDG